MNPAIKYYEKITNKITLRASDFYNGDQYRNYRKSTSLHNFTIGYGTPAQAMGCFCSTAIAAGFEMNAVTNTSTVKDRFMLKLVACWQDDTGNNHPVTIKINGKEVYSGLLFLENVCKGWPAIYFDVDADVMQEGINELGIINNSSGGGILIVARAEVFMRTPFEHFTIRSCPDFAVEGERFNVCLNLAFQAKIEIEYPKEFVELIENKGDEFVFKALKTAEMIELVFSSDGQECRTLIEDIYSAKEKTVYVGLNSDDTRHDETGELERQLANIAETQLGNFFAFRYQNDRTNSPDYVRPRQLWFDWIDYCVSKGLFFQFSINLPDIDMQEIMDVGGKYFRGVQLHELYLAFQPALTINGVLVEKKGVPEYITQAKDFKQKKQAYVEYVNEKVSNPIFKGCQVYLGDPSLLTIYSTEAKIDGILCEAVTNSALLYGAGRKIGKDFGSHIAGDWYLGSQHDDNAIRRIDLLMNLTYTYGGNWITVESTIFKTNAMHRCDWEDDFCVKARQCMRDFYRFSCKDNRPGKPVIPLAFLYGNLESIFWMQEDRLPELIDIQDWDRKVWGKWEDTGCRMLWKASNGWLKHLQFSSLGTDEWLTMMFSGTPYGQVDVALPYSDLSGYKAVSFLGWNTMNHQIYDNLKKYVENGGVLVICGCHFDTRVSFEQDVSLFNDGKVSQMIGADIVGKDNIVAGEVHRCKLENITAEQISKDCFLNLVGNGKVYFFNYFDYPSDPRLITKIENLLDKIGSNISQASDLAVEGENAKFINFNLWQDECRIKVYLSNIDWEHTEAKEIYLRYQNNVTRIEISGGKTKVIEFLK